MHTLLGYRFDHFLLEKIPEGSTQTPFCQMLSLRMVIPDLAKEKCFYLQLLGVTPLIESDQQVILPISPGVTLNLISAEKPISLPHSESLHPLKSLELDLQIENIETTWQTARDLFHCPDDVLCRFGSKKMFHVISPAGIILRFWQ
jgi:hypothetical protein